MMAYSFAYIYTVLFLNIAFLEINSQDTYFNDYGFGEWEDNYDNLSNGFTCFFDCFSSTKRCVNGTCVCAPGYFPNDDNECVKCRSHGQICEPCCVANLKCIDGFCQYPNRNLLKYVSSLALGIALILGVTALGTVVWKLCFSSHCSERERYRRSSESSINSIQRLVDARLRDRPPTYTEVISARRNEIRRVLQNVEAPPPYTLFCTDGNGNIYQIYENNTISNKDNAIVPPCAIEETNENQENNQNGNKTSTDQMNLAVISTPESTVQSKETLCNMVDSVNGTLHI